MKAQPKIDEWALHAYVDGELAGELRDDVESWLDSHPEDAERVAAWRRQKGAIKEAYASALDEPIPGRLRKALRHAQAYRALWLRPQAIAASLLLILAGAVAGFILARGPFATEDTAKRALVAHEIYAAEARHAVEVSAADKEDRKSVV